VIHRSQGPKQRFFGGENSPKRENERKGLAEALLEKNGLKKKSSPYFDLSEA
jgi:hypothetical protein